VVLSSLQQLTSNPDQRCCSHCPLVCSYFLLVYLTIFVRAHSFSSCL
jgi:hypothetical protein